MKQDLQVIGTIRKMLKAENARWGTYSTIYEVLRKVSGKPETIKRAYRAVVAEIRQEEKSMQELALSLDAVEEIAEEKRMDEFRTKAFYYSAISFSAGFAIGALLLIL